MANTRGIFTLGRIEEKQLLGTWVDLDDVWIGTEVPNTGYFAGGLPGPLSSFEKVNYINDTIANVPGATLSVTRWGTSATGSPTAGYFGGGYTPSDVSTMDKITYSTDTTSYVPGANLTVARAELAASSARANGLSQPIAAVLNNV